VESKNGISANQLKKMLSISYTTAWYLCHRIRKAMEETNPTRLIGTKEIDKSYIDGGCRHVGSGNFDHKSMVYGAIQRAGEVRLQIKVCKNTSETIPHKFVAESTRPKTERVKTDDYLGLADSDKIHEMVNHYADKCALGDVHTNSVESVSNLFKRSIAGSYRQVGAKHFQSYLDEFEWRFN
jgi:hypothetical protein